MFAASTRSSRAAASTTRSSARWSRSALATVIAVPLGMLAAIYLVEYGGGRRFARTVTLLRRRDDRRAVDRGRPVHLRVLDPRSRLPEVRLRRRARAADPHAAGVVRSTEEMLKLVPNELREASLRAGRAEVADDPAGGAAHRHRRHHHRHHAGCGPRHGRDRAAAAARRHRPAINFNPFAGTAEQVRRSRCRHSSSSSSSWRPATPSRAVQRGPGARALVLIIIIGVLSAARPTHRPVRHGSRG